MLLRKIFGAVQVQIQIKIIETEKMVPGKIFTYTIILKKVQCR
jgi:hypothetical protein